MDLQPSSRQRELIARARHLARERFAARADRHDRDAAFPFEDYADLRAEGLLGLCVPERYGGLGADYETYCLVSEQLAQGNASTALTFNMHCLTMLMMGPIADNMAIPPGQRERHEALRAAKYREVVEDGAFYGQPHSEPVEQGETDTTLAVGSSSSLSGAPPRITPRPLFGSATSPGSSARSICRYPRTRRVCPFPATGTRWGCAPQ
jgi:alkylation response protein AidB-like acyl-CoA dehydrogenase